MMLMMMIMTGWGGVGHGPCAGAEGSFAGGAGGVGAPQDDLGALWPYHGLENSLPDFPRFLLKGM